MTRLNDESPRSRILLQAGMLEELLRYAILHQLRSNKSANELFGPDTSLGLSTLAKYAHAFGLVGDKERAAIQIFAKIRNKIAHSWSADFGDHEIQKLSTKLTLINLHYPTTPETHQLAFARADYLGVYLIEELTNRFYALEVDPSSLKEYVSSIRIDPSKGTRILKRSGDT